MRDPNRIKPFCTELAELWSNWPDLRFGQIMSNISKYVQFEKGKDIFYIEDEELLKVLLEQLRGFE